MRTEGNWTYGGDLFVMYINIKNLCYIHEINTIFMSIILQLIKIDRKKPRK